MIKYCNQTTYIIIEIALNSVTFVSLLNFARKQHILEKSSFKAKRIIRNEIIIMAGSRENSAKIVNKKSIYRVH